MSFFYSPFTDKMGNQLDIFHIQHRHLSQIKTKEIEEGYQIEFKKELSETVKKKIPKIITSFANSAGGWLFIGVDETTHDLDKLERPKRTDYSQVLSQILRQHVSPLPRFEARFLKHTNSDHGVLVVYVYEGANPPYVVDGTIYVRNGSSSEPIKSQRSDIDILYQKRETFNSKVAEFCKRDIYYPMDDGIDQQVVLCNIYVMNTATPVSDGIGELFHIVKKIMEMSPNQFRNYSFSNSSVIFQNSHVIGHYQIGVNMEIFSNYSVKIHMPIRNLSDYEEECAVERLRLFSGQKRVNEFLILDGYSACQGFQYIVQQYFDFLHTEGVDLSQCIYKISLENAENSILYFDSDPYEKYVRQHNVPFCCKNALITPMKYLDPRKKNKTRSEFATLLVYFFLMFGLDPQDATLMYAEAMKANPMRNLNLPK